MKPNWVYVIQLKSGEICMGVLVTECMGITAWKDSYYQFPANYRAFIRTEEIEWTCAVIELTETGTGQDFARELPGALKRTAEERADQERRDREFLIKTCGNCI